MRPLIEQIVGPNIAVIDTGEAVSLQLQKKLIEQDLLMPNTDSGVEVVFWTNSQSVTAPAVIQTLYGSVANIEQLAV